MRLIQPVEVIGKKLEEIFFIDEIFGDGCIQPLVVGKKLNVYAQKINHKRKYNQ